MAMHRPCADLASMSSLESPCVGTAGSRASRRRARARRTAVRHAQLHSLRLRRWLLHGEGARSTKISLQECINQQA
eukprot:13955669-Alexandrium_andersonii.AAC.1